MPRELIDADFTVAFSLVEMAESESQRGNGQLASQLLERAERMLDDIRGRLQRMTASQKEAFEPRCAKLAEDLNRARKQAAPETPTDIPG